MRRKGRYKQGSNVAFVEEQNLDITLHVTVLEPSLGIASSL